jgi:hypothetical protein
MYNVLSMEGGELHDRGPPQFLDIRSSARPARNATRVHSVPVEISNNAH